MSEFDRLLDLQVLDTHTDQLRHRLTHDPLIADRAAARAARAEVESSIADRSAALAAIRQRQGQLEGEVTAVEARIAKEEGVLYGGTLTAHKDLEALQHEIATLRGMQGDLEVLVLEQMELADPVEAELAQLGADLDAAEAAVGAAEAAVTVLEAELGVELESIAGRRAELVAGLPEAIVSAYEATRRSSGGVGAARLGAGGKCEACHLTLSRVDVDQIKKAPPDELVRCPECGRILVR